jgi:hypothetical protein
LPSEESIKGVINGDDRGEPLTASFSNFVVTTGPRLD